MPQHHAITAEISQELHNILQYWSTHTVDTQHGGFIGQIDTDNQIQEQAEKGSVLNARILWSFAAAYPITKDRQHLAFAERAFHYLRDYFYDPENGGIYWSVHYDGTPKDTKNQIYAIAFTIYGLSEFYAISQNEEALQLAMRLYQKIEQYSFDPLNKGYFEAFTQHWDPIQDQRLSDKDANEKKTMNTHLHIVEAYANLYRIWKDETLRKVIIQLLETIATHFINPETWHLKLFFDDLWNEKPDVISYGHDIEAAWLLQWCAEISESEPLIARYREYAVQMAEVTKEGIDTDGGLWYEFDSKKKEMIAEKHWWPQAELWIGMINAWQLTGNTAYYKIFEKNWHFVQRYLLDTQNGEWIWGIHADTTPIAKDKAGFWKCPYHNSRACIEVLKRLNEAPHKQ